MNCCGNQNHENDQQGPQKHQSSGKGQIQKWMMALCCILPIVLVAILFLANNASGAFGNSVALLLILLCPLSHLMMMRIMRKKNHGGN